MSASPIAPPRSVLGNRDFRKLWLAQTISVYGTPITILAVPIVAALTLHVSAFEFGPGLPPIAISPVRHLREIPAAAEAGADAT